MFVVSACAGFLLSSCNTWVGMGRDVQKMGQGMENQAYRNKQPAAPTYRTEQNYGVPD
jgi:predicted small secreted protein